MPFAISPTGIGNAQASSFALADFFDRRRQEERARSERIAAQARQLFERRRAEGKRKRAAKKPLGGLIGGGAGTGIGAILGYVLAPATGGLSLAASTALGAGLGGNIGGAFGSAFDDVPGTAMPFQEAGSQLANIGSTSLLSNEVLGYLRSLQQPTGGGINAINTIPNAAALQQAGQMNTILPPGLFL